MTYNQIWFLQAAQTPFGHGEFYEMMGVDGLTKEADAIILISTFLDSIGVPMSPEIATLLNECRRATKIGKVRVTIEVEDYTDGIKDWKETTSTAPSGHHLGHYKAALHHEDRTQIHVGMLNGKVPDRSLSRGPLRVRRH